MNNEMLKKKYGQVQDIVLESSYKKGIKSLSKKKDYDTISKLKSIIKKLQTFEISTQYKNHVLSDGRYELHVKGDVLLVYKYVTNILYIDLVLLDLTNHRDLNDSLDTPQDNDLKRTNEGVKSNGIYSVLNNKWIKEPTQASIPDIDKEKFEKLFDTWEDKYFDLLNKVKEDVVKETPMSELVNDFIEDIYDLRKSSIAQEGEYGLGNLVFKEFRNLGYLDNLKDLKNELKSKELSLESLNKLSESINNGDTLTIESLKQLIESKI